MAAHARKQSPHLKIAPEQPPMQMNAPPVNLIDDPLAPELFSSGCCGFSIGQGHVTLTFESARCNHYDAHGTMNRVVVGRIVMSVQAAQALAIELNNSLQRSGLSPSRAATVGMVPQ